MQEVLLLIAIPISGNQVSESLVPANYVGRSGPHVSPGEWLGPGKETGRQDDFYPMFLVEIDTVTVSL